MIDLRTVKRVHFTGIGGIGVSAIARMFLAEGKTVSGSDWSRSVVTDELEKLGATIYDNQVADNISADIDLLIYSIAAPTDNPERHQARELGLLEISYPQVLGLISQDKFTIAVSGTHGKTTTTAMIAKIFLEAKLDPTVIVGSLLKDHKSNFIAGQSKYLIVEACEYKRSFLNLSPSVLVITNIDTDHLDYYKDLADIQSAFRELADKVPATGAIVADADNAVVKDALQGLALPLTNYQAVSQNFSLQIPGEHNIRNAKAAYAVGKLVGISDEIIAKALQDFTGTWRRFDYLGQTKNGVPVYDDYAHHPQEIQATLAGAREKWPDRKIVVVFQPHLYSRTKLLLEEFAKSFAAADEVIIAPIYAAREMADPTINHELLAAAIGAHHSAVTMVNSLDETKERLKAITDPQTVIITMGAGDIVEVGQALV